MIIAICFCIFFVAGLIYYIVDGVWTVFETVTISILVGLMGALVGLLVYMFGGVIISETANFETVSEIQYITDFTYDNEKYYFIIVENDEYGYWIELAENKYSYHSVPHNNSNIIIMPFDDTPRVEKLTPRIENEIIRWLWAGAFEVDNEYLIYIPQNSIYYD